MQVLLEGRRVSGFSLHREIEGKEKGAERMMEKSS